MTLATLTSFTRAEEFKPVIASETKAIEASIVIDPALKAETALYDRLLASGKREYDKARSEAAREYKNNRELFSDGRKFYYQRTDKLRSAIGPYLSIVRTDDTFTGGAHPNHAVDTLLWDKQAGRFINIKPFFRELADDGPVLTRLSRLLRVALVAEKKTKEIEIENPDADEWVSAIKPKITQIGGIALAPSREAGKSAGMIAYFSPYAVGTYAEGPYSLFVPWTAFKDDLSTLGLELFGGERPEGDDKKD